MSLVEFHNHHSLGAKLESSDKVTLEPFEKKEGTNIRPRFEYHYSYYLIINNNPLVMVTFIAIDEPRIEEVNRLLMNIMKSIYKPVLEIQIQILAAKRTAIWKLSANLKNCPQLSLSLFLGNLCLVNLKKLLFFFFDLDSKTPADTADYFFSTVRIFEKEPANAGVCGPISNYVYDVPCGLS